MIRVQVFCELGHRVMTQYTVCCPRSLSVLIWVTPYCDPGDFLACPGSPSVVTWSLTVDLDQLISEKCLLADYAAFIQILTNVCSF